MSDWKWHFTISRPHESPEHPAFTIELTTERRYQTLWLKALFNYTFPWRFNVFPHVILSSISTFSSSYFIMSVLIVDIFFLPCLNFSELERVGCCRELSIVDLYQTVCTLLSGTCVVEGWPVPGLHVVFSVGFRTEISQGGKTFMKA